MFCKSTIAYNASQADAQTALDGMGIMGGSIARAGTTNVNAVAGLTITMTRLTLNDVGSQGARWTVMPFDGLRTATGFVDYVLEIIMDQPKWVS